MEIDNLGGFMVIQKLYRELINGIRRKKKKKSMTITKKFKKFIFVSKFNI